MKLNAESLRVKIFADGADKAEMLRMHSMPWIKGFTTNPTLMRKAGVSDYEAFAKDVLNGIWDRPISFEVFSDDFTEMRKQALKIASWGDNVYVKIPITNTLGESSVPLIKTLASEGVKLNVTAMMTLEQVSHVADVIVGDVPAILSVFAGRIADTGRDPVPMMRDAVAIVSRHPNQELLWASPRELLNVFQADKVGCHIITATNEVLNKIGLIGRDLDEFSLDTVKMFRRDAVAAGFSL